MKQQFLILFFVAAAMISMAQKESSQCKYTLSGRVIDEHDKSALGYATLSISELTIATTSDDKGNYRFDNLCSGIYTVKISHVNCEPIELKVEIKKNTTKNFYPEHHAELLKNIEVTASKTAEQTTQTENNIAKEKLDQSKGFALGEALKNVTGVNSLNTGNSISKPVIHGMHSNRILILNNGIRQEGQQWGVEHAPEVDPFTAGKLSVIKGANSVRYGSDAIAGVVIVDPKPLRDTAGVNGELNLVGMSNGRSATASAHLEGKFEKLKAFSWRVQGTFKQNGTISAPNYYMINTGLKEHNFSYTLGWKKQKYGAEIFYSQFNTTLGIFGASHIGNVTDLQRAFESPVPLETGTFTYEIKRPLQRIEHELFKFRSYLLTGRAGKLSLTYARQYNLRYEFDKHGGFKDSTKPELQFELTSHTSDLVWEHNSFKRFTGSAGLSGIMQGNTYEGRALIPNFMNYGTGAFWIERWKSTHLELEGGIRYDYKKLEIYKYRHTGNSVYELITPVHLFKNISGNIGAIYRKDSTLNLSFNLGTAWRAPAVNELYSDGLHHGAAAIEFGFDSLKSERTYNMIFTARYSPDKKLTFEASPYIHYINNFIYRRPSSEPYVTIRGAFPAFNFRQTDAILQGCDFYLNYKITKNFEITSKASLLRAWNQSDSQWLILMPSDRYEGELTYRFKRTSRIPNSYLSASALYVTKQWRVPANSDFVDPPPAYYLINFHASCSFRFKNQEMSAGLSVYNLLNTTYRDYLDRFRYFTDAMGRNITLRLTYRFNQNKNNINNNEQHEK